MMTRDQYMAFHREMCDRMVDITRRKNADYCGDSSDPFHNFTAVERSGITDTTTGFLVRMQDKFARVVALAGGRKAQVLDETLEDTLVDFANYCLLLAGYLKSRTPFADPHPKFPQEAATPTQSAGQLQLRVGGEYRTRGGRVVTIVAFDDSDHCTWGGISHPYVGDDGGYWHGSGKFLASSTDPYFDDLVEEVTPE